MMANAFYDEDKTVIMSLGFCCLGCAPNGGDLAPCPECEPQWHDQVLSQMSLVKFLCF
jgi:hypothetical protein